MTHETKAIYESLHNCINLRDNYMATSLQRLGDNPKDFDGQPLPPDIPESDTSMFTRWKIYPKPPPPRWHWKPKPHNLTPEELEDLEEFEFSKCSIPGPSTLHFELDEQGVYQVFDG